MFLDGVVFFCRAFGYDGIKAMLLHGALDYMCGLLGKVSANEEILARALAWIKFCGNKEKMRNLLSNSRSTKEFLEKVKKSGYNSWVEKFMPDEHFKKAFMSNIEKEALIYLSKRIIEMHQDYADKLLERARKRGLIDNTSEARICFGEKIIDSAKAVASFIEKNFEDILQSLKRDKYCPDKYIDLIVI